MYVYIYTLYIVYKIYKANFLGDQKDMQCLAIVSGVFYIQYRWIRSDLVMMWAF